MITYLWKYYLYKFSICNFLIFNMTLCQRCANVVPTLCQLYSIPWQRWHNVATTLAQCGIGNGEPTLAQRSKLCCANVANQRCANGAAWLRWANVGPTLDQRSCAIWAGRTFIKCNFPVYCWNTSLSYGPFLLLLEVVSPSAHMSVNVRGPSSCWST